MAKYRDNGGNKGYYGRKKSSGERYSGSTEQRKKSGCQTGIGKDSGNRWVSGWNVSSQGYMKFLAFPYKGTKRVVSKNGVEWESWVAKVTYPDRSNGLVPCLYEVATHRIVMKDMGMVANPKAPNGGYWGTMFKK